MSGASKRTTKPLVRFDIFTVMTIRNTVFWDFMPCGSCKNRHFRGTYHLIIKLTLMMEAIHSSKRPVLITATQHNIPEDSILH
jgi:hypothetical protein